MTHFNNADSKVYEWGIEHSKEQETAVQCGTLIDESSKLINRDLNTPGKWKTLFNATLGLSGVQIYEWGIEHSK